MKKKNNKKLFSRNSKTNGVWGVSEPKMNEVYQSKNKPEHIWFVSDTRPICVGHGHGTSRILSYIIDVLW